MPAADAAPKSMSFRGINAAEGNSSGAPAESRESAERREALRLRVALEAQRQYRVRNLVAFWLLGFLNNYYYCVVLSASESIADGYGLKSLTALLSWADIIGGCFIRLLNAFVFNHIGYNWRIAFVALQAFVGVFFVCVSPFCGSSDGFRFFLSVVGIFSIGNASALGESAMLGYLDRLPPMTLGGWSSGTGLSGVAASLVYLGLGAIPGMTNTWIFLANMPTMALYCWSFYRLVVPIRPDELDRAVDAALARSLTSSSNAGAGTGLYGDDARVGVEAGASAAEVAAGVDALRPRSNWADKTQWGPLTLKAPPGFAEKEEAQRPVVVVDPRTRNNVSDAEASNVATDAEAAKPGGPVGSDEAPLIATASGKSAMPLHGVDAQLIEEARREADGEMPQGCFSRILACIMPGTPLWTVKLTHRLVFWNCLNLMLVYMFEYSVQFMAPYSFPTQKDHPDVDYDWATRNAFVLSQFCYQFGVLLSRSSLHVVRIRRVWILSAIQFVNFVCWIVQAKVGVLASTSSRDSQAAYTGVLLAWMVGVGLMGGASYVNVFFNILNDDDPTAALAPEADEDTGREGGNSTRDSRGPHVLPAFNFKELAMNVGALYATLGITLGCLLDVVISNSLLAGGGWQ